MAIGFIVLVTSTNYGQEPPAVDQNAAIAAAVTGLTDALRDPSPGVRDAAAMALREMGPDAKPAIPALAQMLRDPDGYLRITAAHTLDKLGADAAASVVPLLRDCDPRVRALAAETLRAIGPDAKAAVPMLTESLRDPCPSVRDAAALALQEMGPEAKYAIPALAIMLADPDGYLRITAAHSLERLGPDAIPAVVMMLRAPDPRVREIAANALTADPGEHGRCPCGKQPPVVRRPGSRRLPRSACPTALVRLLAQASSGAQLGRFPRLGTERGNPAARPSVSPLVRRAQIRNNYFRIGH